MESGRKGWVWSLLEDKRLGVKASVSCCSSITTLWKTLKTLTCLHKDAWDAQRAVFRKSKISLSRKCSQKSKRRTAEPRRNPTEQNKTTGRQHRVVLFFLQTAVPPAEASRPGTLTLLRAGSGAAGGFIPLWHHTGQGVPLASPARPCRESWEDGSHFMQLVTPVSRFT